MRRYTKEECAFILDYIDKYPRKEAAWQVKFVDLAQAYTQKIGISVTPLAIANKYYSLTKMKRVKESIREEDKRKELVESGPRYALMIHTNGDKSGGMFFTCATREDVAKALSTQLREKGIIPEHSIFARVKFVVEIKEMEA